MMVVRVIGAISTRIISVAWVISTRTIWLIVVINMGATWAKRVGSTSTMVIITLMTICLIGIVVPESVLKA